MGERVGGCGCWEGGRGSDWPAGAPPLPRPAPAPPARTSNTRFICSSASRLMVKSMVRGSWACLAFGAGDGCGNVLRCRWTAQPQALPNHAGAPLDRGRGASKAQKGATSARGPPVNGCTQRAPRGRQRCASRCLPNTTAPAPSCRQHQQQQYHHQQQQPAHTPRSRGCLRHLARPSALGRGAWAPAITRDGPAAADAGAGRRGGWRRGG